jgi:hypothetical protein
MNVVYFIYFDRGTLLEPFECPHSSASSLMKGKHCLFLSNAEVLQSRI